MGWFETVPLSALDTGSVLVELLVLITQDLRAAFACVITCSLPPVSAPPPPCAEATGTPSCLEALCNADSLQMSQPQQRGRESNNRHDNQPTKCQSKRENSRNIWGSGSDPNRFYCMCPIMQFDASDLVILDQCCGEMIDDTGVLMQGFIFVLYFHSLELRLSKPQRGRSFWKWKWSRSVVSLPGSSVHGTFQARVLEWIAISFSRGSSRPRERTWVSRIAGGSFTVWAIYHFYKHLLWDYRETLLV